MLDGESVLNYKLGVHIHSTVKLISKSSNKLICCIYWLPNNVLWCIFFNRLSYLWSSFFWNCVILGYFIVHNKICFGLTKTDCLGRATEKFAITNIPTKIIIRLTYFPCIPIYYLHPLDLFLTTNTKPYHRFMSYRV